METPNSTVVRCGTQRWHLLAGQELTFGRSQDRDIRIGHDPMDDFVSREAGSFTCLKDGTLIRNTSRTQAFRFLAMPGPELSIRPGMAVGTMPFAQVRLDIPGRYGAAYTIHIETRDAAERLDESETDLTEGEDEGTRYQTGGLSNQERRLLAALCEPVLLLAGSRHASYREIAERLTQTPKGVRTGLDRLRNRLSDDHGIPGLRADDASIDPNGYLQALAHWAIDTGEIDKTTIADALPPR